MPCDLLFWICMFLSFSGIIGKNKSGMVMALAMTTEPSRNQRTTLPRKTLIGYGRTCDHVRTAVHDGVNVVIWVFMNIVASCDAGDSSAIERQLEQTGRAKIQTDLDLEQIRQLIAELDDNGYSDVIHLVSFGGWNGPHLDPNLTSDEWYAGWKDSIASDLFHGIDWDLEGHDDLDSPTNYFTKECLDKMGKISRLMKEDGFLVGMAPPQSYMNFDSTHFSRYVNLTETDRAWHPEFHYFGANVYSYLLATYGKYIDFISMQLYESYSLAAMAVYHQKMAPESYLISYIQDLVIQRHSKYFVDFSQDKELEMEGQYVELPLSKLVIGLANGWAADKDNMKHVYISPEQVDVAYKALKTSSFGDLTPRGFMFWTIEEEGANGVHLAQGLSKVLGIRDA